MKNMKLKIVLFSFFMIIVFASKANASITQNTQLGQNGSLTNGLVGYWTFDNKNMAGVTAYDQSGQGNNGTLTNMSDALNNGRVTGKLGQALKFDGVDDYVSITNGLASNLSGGKFTISAWAYANSQPTWGTIIKNWGDQIGGAFHFGLENVSGDLSLYVTQSNGTLIGPTREGSGSPLPLNSWQHVVAVADGTNISLYRNGISVGSPVSYNGTLKTSFSYTNIAAKPGDTGGVAPTATGYWNGSIDDVRIYNRALSGDEIKRLYNLGGTLHTNTQNVGNNGTLTSGLVGYWDFNNNHMAGVTAYDQSGQGNNGTLTNGPTRAIGKLGQALKFDGVDDYVNVPSLTLSSVTAQTISLWVTFKTINNQKDLLGWWDGSNGVFVEEDTTHTSTLLAQIGNGNQYGYAPADTITTNTWYHVIVVYDGSQTGNANVLKMYINGSQQTLTFVGTIPSSVTSASALNIGNLPSFSRYVNGSIDDVRIYNRALSGDEIKRLYNLGGTLHANTQNVGNNGTLTTGLVGYWDFNNNHMAGVTAYDQSGQGNDGTLTNMSDALNNGRVTGKLGQALKFDGVDDIISLNLNPDIDSSDMSVSAWIKPTLLVNGDIIGRALVDLSCCGNQLNGWEFFTNSDGTLTFERNLGALPILFTSTQTCTVNKFCFVSVTYNNTSGVVNIYINNNSPDSGTISTGTIQYVVGEDGGTTIGANDFATGRNSFFNGSIDDVRIYNRALSGNEIKRLYNMGR